MEPIPYSARIKNRARTVFGEWPVDQRYISLILPSYWLEQIRDESK